MFLFWRIRYLDSNDRQFKDRDLWLRTDTLDPVNKVAVETAYAMRETQSTAMQKFRHLFSEQRPEWDRMTEQFATVCLPDYFEDEHSKPLSRKRMAAVLTGDPDAIMVPAGTRQHDVEYELADKPFLDLSQITVSPDQLKVLAIFTRDLRELLSTALFKDGPGSIRGSGAIERWVLETGVSDEEIRSFVTIFRRFYMESERANFAKAVAVYAAVLGAHPIVKWAQASGAAFDSALGRPPETSLVLGLRQLPFSRERLIDVYLYTQYAHQPDERRTRQYTACLEAVGGSQSVLAWLFLSEIWSAALEIHNVGVVIANFFESYCRAHNIPPAVIPSLRECQVGLGSLEKKADRDDRVLREKVTELAEVLWKRAGQPEGGPTRWLDQARQQLQAITKAG